MAKKIWISVGIIIVGLVVLWCVAFGKKTSWYQCKACLGTQCATYPDLSPTETNAKKDAQHHLCSKINKDILGDCFQRPQSDFTYECKEEQRWEFFPAIPPI